MPSLTGVRICTSYWFIIMPIQSLTVRCTQFWPFSMYVAAAESRSIIPNQVMKSLEMCCFLFSYQARFSQLQEEELAQGAQLVSLSEDLQSLQPIDSHPSKAVEKLNSALISKHIAPHSLLL
jgi:hypothetical protein